MPTTAVGAAGVNVDVMNSLNGCYHGLVSPESYFLSVPGTRPEVMKDGVLLL
jgi:hypothetical protein